MAKQTPELRPVATACRTAFLVVAFFSFLVNLLMLTVPIYMLQIFDRVLASRSYDTLIYLTIIAVGALFVYALLDIARSRVLNATGTWLDNKVSPIALSRSADELLMGGDYAPQSLRDIATIRTFLISPAIFSLFDSPWTPLFLLAVFLMQPILGMIAVIGAIILFILAIINDFVTRHSLAVANGKFIKNQAKIDRALQNVEVIQAMGMLPNVVKSWFNDNQDVIDLQSKVAARSATIVSISKFIRLTLQLFMLGTGALLVIESVITPGVMIAASIITARALAPIEQAISSWKQFKNVRYAYKRLREYVERNTPRAKGIELPETKGDIAVEGLTYVPPKSTKPILTNINFEVKSGETLALIGPSGAGKSTLARLMLGIWKPFRGAVRLDGADVYDWDREHFGQEVGYLPQSVELFHGTVRDNIARLGEADDASVVAAAELAGAHDMILHLPNGYDFDIEEFSLSGGQRQRIALARAFYGNPRLIVLDEPNSNLDSEGEKALMESIKRIQEKKITLILISHRLDLVKYADRIAVMSNGQISMIGTRDEVFQRLQKGVQQMHTAQPAASNPTVTPEKKTEEGDNHVG